MKPISFEGREPVSTPHQELARVRGMVAERHMDVDRRGESVLESQVAEHVLDQYATVTPHEVLTPEYALRDHQTTEIVLKLSPETHDSQMEHLLGILQEHGIRNAMQVVAKMNNPHIYDDFHRLLIQFISGGNAVPGLNEKDPLWKPLHMCLYEVSLPEADEEAKRKQLSELISGMEQFYAGMLSISGDAKNREVCTIEIANSNGSDQFVFYVGVPQTRKGLFEKQILALFPHAHVSEHTDDYNIFNTDGVSVASYAHLSKHALYPLKSYEDFDIDPLSSILNSFSKIDREGEGAAIQIIIGAREDSFAKECTKALEHIRKGKKISDALGEINQSVGGMMLKDVLHMFKGQDTIDKEKEGEVKRAQAVDQATLEQFVRKLKSPFVATNIRIASSAATQMEAESILRDLQSSFNQFELGSGNRIEWKDVATKNIQEVLKEFSLRTFNTTEKMILNLDEMTTCIHFPASSIHHAAPQLKQSQAGTAPAPLDLPRAGTLIGMNTHRGMETPIYISPEDRMRHFYVIGQTGTGKTTLLKNMIIQDIQAGKGVCFVDPHGSDINDILAAIPQSRYEDVIYFDPASTTRPMALNMLEYDVRFPEQKTFVVNEMFSIFQKLYGAVPESMGPMFEQYFRNATNLVIEDPESGCTLLDVSRVMSNKAFRDMKISRCKNPVVVQFWKEIAEKAGGEASLANVVPYITSKFDVFLANEIMRPIVAQEKSSFNFREIMDGKKILLVNLSKGRLGDINSHLIGLILVGKILMAALSRVDAFGTPMNDFFLYLDEFQNITTDSIAVILSEARKYRLSLTMAHQFIAQLDDKIKNAVFGNVGSMAVYRVGTEDAEFFEKQFTPLFAVKDIINLDNYHSYVKLLSNGRPATPFSMQHISPVKGNTDQVPKLKELSALVYGRERSRVDEEIMVKYNSK
jgi:Helicase HerA, central domain/TraM recognition site of TraD and TraG